MLSSDDVYIFNALIEIVTVNPHTTIKNILKCYRTSHYIENLNYYIIQPYYISLIFNYHFYR